MEKFTVDGVVIKTSVTGESDRIVWVLTRNRGIIRAFAKGARGTKSRLHASTSLFSYCTFSFREKNDVCNVTEAEIINVFFDLRKDMETLTLAQYFCEVILKTVTDKCDEEIYMRLLLNSFHLLCKGEKHELLIKSVFEMRIMCEAGYMPSLVGCKFCGEYYTDKMYFDCFSGEVYCAECGKNRGLMPVSGNVISAMRHICYSEFSKIFSFELSEESLSVLRILSEKYLSNVTGQEFNLLKYYSNLR